jgi:hypothetical protein
MARGSGYNLFLTPSNALFFLRQAGSSNDLVPTDLDVFTMTVVGANPTPKITGRDELPGKSSYFLGSDPKKWHTSIPNFGKVQYEDIYPGIDLVYHGIQGQLEYDFVLHPGTSPETIAIEFTGVKNIRLNPRGELVLETVLGQVCFHKPVAYQEDQGQRRTVKAHYKRMNKNRVGFAVEAYDSSKTLIIDPLLIAEELAGTDRRIVGEMAHAVKASGLRLVAPHVVSGDASKLGESPDSEVGKGALPRGSSPLRWKLTSGSCHDSGGCVTVITVFLGDTRMTPLPTLQHRDSIHSKENFHAHPCS